jgi:acyl homoserine lactone synthase
MPLLRDTMFRDRAIQFRDRLRWDVTVDEAGHERDDYDDEDPLYVVWQRADGRHGGSLRLLPTMGRTMVNDHFLSLTNGVEIRSPLVWECTRFCLSPDPDRRVAAGLMLGGGAVMRAFGLRHLLGVFDGPMIRVYRTIGASPDILGTHGTGRSSIGVGLWSHSPAAEARVALSAGLSQRLVLRWYERSLGLAPIRAAFHG